MQIIPFYIAYLLTKHECVIVPGLGAFVVSGLEESKKEKAGLFCPPRNFLGFNPEIRHNDGLIANAIAKGENISYREACLRIYRYSDRVMDCLEKEMQIQLPCIGILEFSARRKILFTPSSNLSCNVHAFGMDNFYLPPVRELIIPEDPLPPQKMVKPVERTPIHLSIIRRSIAIAVSVIVLLMITTMSVNNLLMQPLQTAQIISLPTIALPETTVVQPVEESVVESPVSEPPVELIEQPDLPSTPYYIVVATLPTLHSAQIQMEQLQKEGFSTVDVVGTKNKHLIYVAKFSNKSEANTFLNQFRTKNPKYSDAWLFIQ